MSAPVAPVVAFPEDVPELADPIRGVRLRAHREDDLPLIVEQVTDPEFVRNTTVPTPYGLDDARAFVAEHVAAGWRDGNGLAWAIEHDTADGPTFGGSIDLRPAGDGSAEVGFGLHPAARGQGVMSSALRLVRDHAFDDLGFEVLRWRAVVGNWGSRRVAAAAGFRFDGTVRKVLNHRGEFLDGWLATMTRDDPREPLGWLDPPVLRADPTPGPVSGRVSGPVSSGGSVLLRPFDESDLARIAEACGDERTQHWLVSLAGVYTLDDAAAYVHGTREMAAAGAGLAWCVTDAEDRCLASVSLEGYANYARRGEIGYWAHPDGRGRGVVTAAVRAVTEWAFRTELVTYLQIRCAGGNLASRHVAEAAGYTRAGVLPAAEPLRDGSWDDLVVYVQGS